MTVHQADIVALAAVLIGISGLIPGARLHAQPAHDELRAGAEEGEAQVQLGFVYMSDRGVPQDDTEAARWFRLAAEQGDAEGQFHLALAHFNGRGVPQDDTEAVRWFRLAAAQGFKPAQNHLSRIYPSSDPAVETERAVIPSPSIVNPGAPQIAFWYGTPDSGYHIYVTGANGGDPTRLTSPPAGGVLPAWSPDGQQIAFTCGMDGRNGICVMDADGNNRRGLISGSVELVNNLSPDGYDSWSPDGTKIVFTSREDGNPDIADGSNQRTLTSSAAADILPSWSPDGMKIVFVSNTDGNSQIHVIDADGTNQRNLSDNFADECFPSWSPDGTQVVFNSDREGSPRTLCHECRWQ